MEQLAADHRDARGLSKSISNNHNTIAITNVITINDNSTSKSTSSSTTTTTTTTTNHNTKIIMILIMTTSTVRSAIIADALRELLS